MNRYCYKQNTPIIALGLVVASLSIFAFASTAQPREIVETRADLEGEIDTLASAYQIAPGDAARRRAYADALFKLGDVWLANDVISPLATSESSNEWDLELGARTALLTMDLDRAERLYRRLAEIAPAGSSMRDSALSALVMVHYQRQDFASLRDLEEPDRDSPRKGGELLEFLQLFEGMPYRIEWAADDHTAHLPFTNDHTQPGALPEVEVTVNGHVFLLTLDTGGDRLYLDVSAAQKAGIRELLVSQAKYAYTQGKWVDEPWGVADEVELGGVTLRNVPVVVAQWKANGPTTDGVIGTAILKQFLSTIDYEAGEITLRPRTEQGMRQYREAMGGRELVRMPFHMAATHLMFTKGQINGHEGLNMFMDSGLAMSMPMVIVNETTDFLNLDKNELEGQPYYWSTLDDHGLQGLPMGPSQALGNVFVEDDTYRSQGFFWDALMSHQYLWKLGSWTIDFDTMSYYFPAESTINNQQEVSSPKTKVRVDNTAAYEGDYEVGGGAAVLKISGQDGTLFLQAPGQQAVAMDAYADGTFGIPLAGATIEFQGDRQSGITGLKLIQGTNVTEAVKK